jgi:hypothetical protein
LLRVKRFLQMVATALAALDGEPLAFQGLIPPEAG